jgi:hypothetical protein
LRVRFARIGGHRALIAYEAKFDSVAAMAGIWPLLAILARQFDRDMRRCAHHNWASIRVDAALERLKNQKKLFGEHERILPWIGSPTPSGGRSAARMMNGFQTAVWCFRISARRALQYSR